MPTEHRSVAASAIIGLMTIGSASAQSPCFSTPQVPGVSPWVRNAPSMAYDAVRQVVVMLGTQTSALGSPARTYVLDSTGWTALAPANSPSARNWATVVYDAGRQRVVLFGGQGTPQDLNDTWEWDGTNWTMVHSGASGGPSRRAGQRMVYDSVRQHVLLYGGFATTSSNYFGDTWSWDGTQWTLLADAPHGPGLRGDHTMVFDPARGVTVMFGGYMPTNGGSQNDTWEWDGAVWSPRPVVTRPAPTFQSAGYFDPQVQRAVLFDRSDNQIWEWNGAAWSSRGPMPGMTTGYPAAAYDEATQRGVIGAGGVTVSMTSRWHDRVLPVFTLNPSDAHVCSLQSAHLSASASGTVTYSWRVTPPGGTPQVLTNGPLPVGAGSAVISGTGSASLTIAPPPGMPLVIEAGTLFDCIASTACGSTVSASASVVVCRADWDCAGGVNSNDVTGFLDAWFTDLGSGGLSTDVNGDGEVNSGDVAEFLNRWFHDLAAGC